MAAFCWPPTSRGGAAVRRRPHRQGTRREARRVATFSSGGDLEDLGLLGRKEEVLILPIGTPADWLMILAGAIDQDVELTFGAIAGVLAGKLHARECARVDAWQQKLASVADERAVRPSGCSSRCSKMLMGLFSFKARPPRRPILTQELDMLKSLAAQTAMSAASALLMEEKLQLEREMAKKERLASIGQMAATLAHEIKNPLSAIKSITQSLQEQATEEDTRQDLDVIVHEVDRLNHSVNQLLQFARSSAQDVTDVSPVLIMERVIKVLQGECKAQNVQIHHRYNGNVPAIYASNFGLQDIFLNLLLNALQEMPSGGEIEIDYSIEGPALLMRISDSGPGIRPDLLTRIFDPFFTTKQKGTGLGLAVVKRKMTEFGGDIEVINLKPQGCQVRLTFPVEKKPPEL